LDEWASQERLERLILAHARGLTPGLDYNTQHAQIIISSSRKNVRFWGMNLHFPKSDFLAHS